MSPVRCPPSCAPSPAPKSARHSGTASPGEADPASPPEAAGATAPLPAQNELVRQVQRALDAALERLDVACERFRAVADAHELRLERQGRALEAERCERAEQATWLQDGNRQLEQQWRADAERLQEADRLAAERQAQLAQRLAAALLRLDRIEQRQSRQRDTQRACEQALDALQQTLRDEQTRARRWRLGLAAGLTVALLLAAAGLALHLAGHAG